MKRLHYLLLICLVALSPVTYAGWNIPVTNFSVADYSAGTQNWQLLTTRNGWLYAANNYGLLEYDGSQWRIYGMYYGNLPRSIAALDDKAIFIGATNDFGVFTPTSMGGMRYTSLMTEDVSPDYGEVWDIEVIGQQVYIFTRHRIIVAEYSDADSISLKNVRTLSTTSRVFCAEEVGGAIYVGTDDGLYLLTGTRMNRIHGSDVLRGYEVRCIQALDEQRLLIGTDLGGLYVYDGTRIAPYRTEADAFIRKNQLYTFAVRGDQIALGTVLQGIAVVTTSGKICRYVSRKEGLQNNTILSMAFDSRDNLWVGLDQGIDYVQLASTRQYFSDEQTNFGTGYATLRVQQGATTRYYYGTNQALYVRTNTGKPLQLVEGSMGQVWSLSEIDGTVFCCHNRGLFIVDGSRVLPLCTDEGFWKVQPLPDGRVLAGSYSGFRVLNKTNGQWQITRVKGFGDTAFRWQVDPTGAVWAVATAGLVHLQWADEQTFDNQSVHPYNEAHDWINISRLGEQIVISSLDYCRVVGADGVLRHDENLMNNCLAGETYYAQMLQDSCGNNLFIIDGTLYIRIRQGETYMPAQPLYSNKPDFVGGFENIYETADGYIIGTLQGYNLLQSSIAANQAAESMPTIYLREVSMVNHDGKAVYGESLGSAGLSTLHSQPSTSPNAQHLSTLHTAYSRSFEACRDKNSQRSTEDCPTVFVLPYDEYALRFSCSIDRTPAGNTMYAYRLLPRDKEFTPLTPRAYYECSSLEQGRYTLQVKCLSAAENALPAEVTRSWQFVVLPPWYMTWWANCLFAVLTLLWLSGVAYVLYVIADRSKRKALHEQQLRILQLENDRTQTRLQAKSQELTRIMHEEAIKQEDLAFAHEQLDKCLHDLQTHNLKKVEERLNNLKQHITSKAGDESIDWQRFEENFDEVNAGFCKCLTERFPWMSKQERKLCVYIHMGMLTKEMGPMLGLSTRGVEMLRYRMRCKMDLDPQANLKDYLTKITSNA